MDSVAHPSAVSLAERCAAAAISLLAALGTIAVLGIIAVAYVPAILFSFSFMWAAAAILLAALMVGFFVGPRQVVALWASLWGTAEQRPGHRLIIFVVVAGVCVMATYEHW